MRFLRLVLVLVLGAAEARAGEVYEDFRGKDVNDQLFRQRGPEAARRMTSEPQGLRITLPAEFKSTVGLSTREPVKGDFEITVGYELLQAERRRVAAASGWKFT